MAGSSLIVTVRNDRAALTELRRALERQTRLPDEIVVVDGGSTDGTRQELERWRFGQVPVRVAVEPDANISQGRNAAVRLASHDWLLCTDAGCCPAPGWASALIDASGRADVAAGVFAVDGGSWFEQCVACTYYPSVSEDSSSSPFVTASHRLFGRRFRARLANGRSLAFSRSAWQTVGGFPEHIYATEDIAFSRTAVRRGCQSVIVPEAVVHWSPRSTWRANAKMLFVYSRGDIRTRGRTRHVIRLAAWAAWPLAMFRGSWPARALAVGGALAYAWLPFRRASLSGIPPIQWWRIPALIAVKDVSQLLGAGAGVLDAARHAPQPRPR